VARIDNVVPNLPASRGRLLPQDLVLKVGEKPIYNRIDLMREVGLIAPGTVTRIKIFRPQFSGRDLSQAREMDVSVEIGKWPVVDEEGIIASKPTREPWCGIVYDYGTTRRRFSSTPAALERSLGVRVLEVLPNTPAAAKDIQPGDLITQVKGQPVVTPRDFYDAVRNLTGPVALKIFGPARSASGDEVEIRPALAPKG
ncbi:MAG TPA: PDZ domain-containing protein, partial [Planctomycetaceae bacterium]|nr:PDZ domain-containing protein [Planctomycetaceae bacterium]